MARWWALAGGVFLASLAVLAPGTAFADVGLVGLAPTTARPGDRVDLRIGCGSCSAGVRFPISLVPLAKAPQPHRCGRNGLCAPVAHKPPRSRPFVFLGRSDPGRAMSDSRPPVAESHLGFGAPDVEPGLYAFVIFCADCYPGPRGSLISDVSNPSHLLRVRDPARAWISLTPLPFPL